MTLRITFFALPAAVLLAAFAGICVMTGTVWPWNEVVHEDGVRTLVGTVFYVEHGARELWPDFIVAVAVAGAVRYYFPPGSTLGAAQARQWRAWLGGIAVATAATIVGGTIWVEGVQALVDNLSQSHTRAGAPLVWGAHWRYHLLDRLAQIFLAFSAVGAVWLWHGRSEVSGRSGQPRLYAASLMLFVATTLVFRLTSEPFRDPTFLGHQLRELFTHALVTLPLAIGVCLECSRSVSAWGHGVAGASRWPMVMSGLAAVCIGGFLLVAALLSDAQSHGQAAGLAALLLPHFAEHALGYLVVPSVAGLIYVWPAARARR